MKQRKVKLIIRTVNVPKNIFSWTNMKKKLKLLFELKKLGIKKGVTIRNVKWKITNNYLQFE